MHLRTLEEASEFSQKIPKFPHGLYQGQWRIAHGEGGKLSETGYLDYCGSVFAATPERVITAIKDVFELESFIEYHINDATLVAKAIFEIVEDGLELDRWTVILCPQQDKIMVAFERARAGVEFRLRYPEDSEVR